MWLTTAGPSAILPPGGGGGPVWTGARQTEVAHPQRVASLNTSECVQG